MKTRLTLATALAGTVLLLAACSTDADADATTGTDATDKTTTEETSTDTSLTDVQDAGVWIVGTEGTYRPFTFHEDGSGDLTGYDVEVARAVAEQLGVEVQFEETQWDALLTGLEAGRFDAVANQVSITPEREETYEFSAPYTFSNGVVVVRADDDSITSFDDLAGKTTAQSLTSSFYTLAEEAGANIEAIEGWAQAVALLEQGRVDATVNDRLTFLDYRTQTGAEGLKIAAQTDDFSRAAFAFSAGDTALAAAVTDALTTLAEDGTLAEISSEFFGEEVHIQPAA